MVALPSLIGVKGERENTSLIWLPFFVYPMDLLHCTNTRYGNLLFSEVESRGMSSYGFHYVTFVAARFAHAH